MIAAPRADLEAERAAAIERRRAALAAEARDAELRARFEGLSDAAKAWYWGEFERAHPRPAPPALRKWWEVQRRNWCLERLAEAVPAKAPGGVP